MLPIYINIIIIIIIIGTYILYATRYAAARNDFRFWRSPSVT